LSAVEGLVLIFSVSLASRGKYLLIVLSSKKWQQIIYEFIYELSLSLSTFDPRKSEVLSYYCKILSNDRKFMAAAEEIYKNRHKGFEKGYHILVTSD
jgi:hypothetical protein